jgi:DNA topoisomerase IA
MVIDIVTKEDLAEFRHLLLKDIREAFTNKASINKQWLKSNEVRKLLDISSGTLQTLRLNKTLCYTRIGGIIYYAHQDIVKMLESNKIGSESTQPNSK